MADVEVGPSSLEDFIASGRTGRRNAMADILDSKHTSTSAAGLDFSMEKLKCSDNEKQEQSQSSGAGNGGSGNS